MVDCLPHRYKSVFVDSNLLKKEALLPTRQKRFL
jgi:hypothetical protein